MKQTKIASVVKVVFNTTEELNYNLAVKFEYEGLCALAKSLLTAAKAFLAFFFPVKLFSIAYAAALAKGLTGFYAITHALASIGAVVGGGMIAGIWVLAGAAAAGVLTAALIGYVIDKYLKSRHAKAALIVQGNVEKVLSRISKILRTLVAKVSDSENVTTLDMHYLYVHMVRLLEALGFEYNSYTYQQVQEFDGKEMFSGHKQSFRSLQLNGIHLIEEVLFEDIKLETDLEPNSYFAARYCIEFYTRKKANVDRLLEKYNEILEEEASKYMLYKSTQS